eukprot:3215755-Lingulodinium_polyedra.AAC.1
MITRGSLSGLRSILFNTSSRPSTKHAMPSPVCSQASGMIGKLTLPRASTMNHHTRLSPPRHCRPA